MSFVIVFCMGAIVGSFLNVCIFRLPEGESVIFPASHCRFCQKPIAWFDNIPAFSFLRLKGKCRHCGQRISWQYFAVEVFTAGLFTFFFATLGLNPIGVVYLILALALLVETVIDWRHQIIPDAITLPGILLGFLASFLFPALHGQTSKILGLAGSFAGAFLGGGILYICGTLAEKILKKEAMGGGDVKLLAMIGSILGWQGVLWIVFVSSFLGSAAGLYLRFRRGDERIPFGPFLAAAAYLYLFFGTKTIQMYAHFIGMA